MPYLESRLLGFLLWLAGFVPLVIFLQMCLGPIIFYATWSVPARRKFSGVDFASLPSRTAEFLATAAAGLVDEGFSTAAHLYTPAKGMQDCYVSIWINRATGDAAELICVMVRGGRGLVLASHSVGFATRYPDGTAVTTSNSRLPGIFSPRASVDAIRLARIASVSLLYRIHRARVVHVGPSPKPVIRVPGAEVEEHLRYEYETMVEQVRAGYFWFDAPVNQFRPTLKGAILMTWKLVFPVKQIRQWHTARNTANRLRAIGMWDEAQGMDSEAVQARI